GRRGVGKNKVGGEEGARREGGRRAEKCCHPPVTCANIRACCREEAAAGLRSATSACQSVMLGAAEARHVATGCWSILPSRCDGRLRGQRLCVPGNGRGQT